MEDIGKRFGRDRSFCFDFLQIDEIIFDDSDDITIYGKTIYFDTYHTITLGITLAQLNSLLRSIPNYGEKVVEVISEGMQLNPNSSTTLVIKDNFSFPLEMDNCILFTTLHRIDEMDIIWDEEDEKTKDEDNKEEDIFAKLNRLRKERLERNKRQSEMKELEDELGSFDEDDEDDDDKDEDDKEGDEDDFPFGFDDDDTFNFDDFFDEDDSVEYAFFVDEIYVLPPTS